MRLVVGNLLLVVGIGLLSCRLGGWATELPGQVQAASWVRTADGWERSGNWLPSIVAPPDLHPLVVAAGEALFSSFALAAFAVPSSRPPRRL